MSERTVDEALETPAEESGSRPSRKKLLLLIIGGVLLLGVSVGVLFFTGVLGKVLGHKEPEKVMAENAPPPAVFFDLPDLLVNLNTTGRKEAFLKLQVSLELERPEDLPRLQAVMPRIIDNFQVYLRELRVEDLRGSGGIYRLREELLARVNAAVAPIKITDVLFKEMLVQ
ncbi:MAG TPA: flagellar basal body-associated FliL family protein [Stellaceae bacterium]|jgi:flagellar FliL protein|nr:flagellar basal body-associated FliL family protein [Stellaceae bacterium]